MAIIVKARAARFTVKPRKLPLVEAKAYLNEALQGMVVSTQSAETLAEAPSSPVIKKSVLHWRGFVWEAAFSFSAFTRKLRS